MQIFAEVTPKPEFFDAAKAAVIGIVEQTRAEAGCLQFDFYENTENGQLFLMEHWASQKAFDFHHAQDYTKAVFKSYENWLATTPRLTTLTKIN